MILLSFWCEESLVGLVDGPMGAEGQGGSQHCNGKASEQVGCE